MIRSKEQNRLRAKLGLAREERLFWIKERKLVDDKNSCSFYEFACIRKTYKRYMASVEILVDKKDNVSHLTLVSKMFNSPSAGVEWLRNIKEN